jgi:hypothetical protein
MTIHQSAGNYLLTFVLLGCICAFYEIELTRMEMAYIFIIGSIYNLFGGMVNAQ